MTSARTDTRAHARSVYRAARPHTTQPQEAFVNTTRSHGTRTTADVFNDDNKGDISMARKANTTRSARATSSRARAQVITKECTRSGFKITGTPDEVAEFFYRDKSQKDGFSPWCKDAEREYNRAYRAALKDADAPRKADANDEGVVAFDTRMAQEGVRTERKRGTSNKNEAKAKRATTTRTRAKAKEVAKTTKARATRKRATAKAQA